MSYPADPYQGSSWPNPEDPDETQQADDYDLLVALRYGWDKFSRNAGVWIGLTLITSAIGFVIYLLVMAGVGALFVAVLASASSGTSPEMVGTMIGLATGGGLVVMVGTVLMPLVLLLVNMSLLRAAVDTVRGRDCTFKSAFRTEGFGQFVLLGLCFSGGFFLISVIAALAQSPVVSILGILAEVAFAVLFSFAPYFVLDRQISAGAALKASYQFVVHQPGPVLITVVLAGLVGGIGALVVIGTIVTVPVALIMTSYAVVKLQGELPAP